MTVGEALQRLQQQNRELASLVAVESPGGRMKAIAKRLDATLVEYLVTQDALLIWVVSPPAASIMSGPAQPLSESRG